MRFTIIIASLLASVAMASPNHFNAVRGGGGGGDGGGDGGSGTTATVTVTTTTTSSAAGATTTVSTGGDGGDGGDGSYYACDTGALYGVPSCCTVNVLDVLSLICETVPETPESAEDFSAICETTVYPGAYCCVATVLGLGVLCIDPVGITN